MIINRKMKILCIIIVVLVIGFLLAQTNIYADVGNNNRYSDTSSNDSGNKGAFSFIISIALFALSNPFVIIVLAVLVAVVVFVIRRKGIHVQQLLQKTLETMDTKGEAGNSSYSVKHMPKNEESIEKMIQEEDAAFSSDEFKQQASECFVRLQNAWTTRTWNDIRPFESNTLFNMHNSQLEEYIRDKKINVIDHLCVSSTKLVNYQVQGDKDILSVRLDAVMRDYVIDEQTKEVLEGDKHKDIKTSYYLEFIRSHGVLSKSGKNITTSNCPNCGAPTEITSSGKCPYCDTIITTGEYSWVLNELTTY